jgi:hypothetical protein
MLSTLPLTRRLMTDGLEIRHLKNMTTGGKGPNYGKETMTEVEQNDSNVGKDSKAKRNWQKPKLQDVSGKVMAQPYIRFT